MLGIAMLVALFWAAVFVLFCNGAFKRNLDDAISATQVFARINDMCYGPLLRSRFAVDAFGLPTTLAAVMILLSAGAANSEAIFCYFFVWLFAVTVQRIAAVRRERFERFPFSRIDGWPWLAMKVFPWVKRTDVARCYGEPLICLAVGSMLCLISKPLGLFVLTGSFSIIINAVKDRKRIQV